MAGETSAAITRPKWRAAAIVKRPVPAPRSTTVDVASRPWARRTAQSSSAPVASPDLRSNPATNAGSRCSGPAWASSSSIQGLLIGRSSRAPREGRTGFSAGPPVGGPAENAGQPKKTSDSV
jgi:hypothetical protein